MADPTGEAGSAALRLDFDRRLLLQLPGSAITSDAGLLPYRELDDAVGLTDTGADTLADARTGKNGRHRLAGLLRQSVFGRLAGYEDVNDADRLCRDPAMRWVVVGDRVSLRTRLTRYPSLPEFVLGYVSGTPMAGAVAALDETNRTAMVEYVCSMLGDYVDDDGMAAPWEAHLVTARA